MRLLGLNITRDRQDAARMEPPVTGPVVSSSVPTASAQMLQAGFAAPPLRHRNLPHVTPDRAAGHATVLACCLNIAGDLSKVPLKLWQRGDGQDQRVREHPATYLLNTEASEGVPAKVARFASVYAYTLRGNGHLYAPRNASGELTALEIVRHDTVAILRNRAARFYEFEDLAEVRRRVPSRSMAHLRYMAADGWTGRSPLTVAAQSMGIAMAAQDAAARTASGGSTRGAIKLADHFESEEDKERNAERIKAKLSDAAEGGWVMLGAEDDIKALDMSAADQQLLESRKLDREQIAGIYRMPMSKLQILENGVKANGEQQAIDYLTDCLLHWSSLVESQLDLAVLTRAEREAGLFLRHDFGALLQPTIKEQYDALNRAVGGPFMRPNEARQKLGLAPVGEGELLNPAPNMTRDDTARSKEGNDE